MSGDKGSPVSADGCIGGLPVHPRSGVGPRRGTKGNGEDASLSNRPISLALAGPGAFRLASRGECTLTCWRLSRPYRGGFRGRGFETQTLPALPFRAGPFMVTQTRFPFISGVVQASGLVPDFRRTVRGVAWDTLTVRVERAQPSVGEQVGRLLEQWETNRLGSSY